MDDLKDEDYDRIAKIKKVDVYKQKVNVGVSNEYSTPNLSFRQPCLAMVCGVRNTGKSFLCSQILAQSDIDKTFDLRFIITPTMASNKAYFGKYIPEENVYEPTKSSIQEVINRVEKERDEFESYLQKLKEWEKYSNEIKNKTINSFTDMELIHYLEQGFLDGQKPVWKYPIVRPPTSILILDDVIGSPAISQSAGLNRIATMSRHIGSLQEDYQGRSACGLACIILTQTYSSTQGQSCSRILRENLSHLILFKNKQKKQMEKIREELASVVDEEKFNSAYEFATAEKYGNLTVDFNPREPDQQFRKNLNELICFDVEKKVLNEKLNV